MLVHEVPGRTRSVIESSNDLQALYQMCRRLFSLWNLSPADQVALLGVARLDGWMSGMTESVQPELFERLGHIFGIHKSLRLLFPQNRELAYRWISAPNKAFGGLSPVEFIKGRGVGGLVIVRSYLNRASGI